MVWWQWADSVHNTSHTTQPMSNSKIAIISLFITNNISISSNTHVPSGTLYIVCDVHSPCAQSWAIATSVAGLLKATSCGGQWIWLQGGGLGTPKARPRPPMGHPIAATCCMPALVGQLGPWGHWVVAPSAHTSPLWAHATTQGGTIVDKISLRGGHSRRCRA